MELHLKIADPAGNITGLVTSPVPRQDYVSVAQEILNFIPADNQKLVMEQVGYIVSPEIGGDIRIEMMGGEFCGNATRSAALLGAKQTTGIETVRTECSSISAPIPVLIDHDNHTSFAQMPIPLSWTSVPCGQFGDLGLVEFDGIAHVIAIDQEASQENFYKIADFLPNLDKYDALGVMFYASAGNMAPYVKVFSGDTLYLEGSCGSGTTATALWLSHLAGNVSQSYTIPQPSGTLTASVTYESGVLQSITMGGDVVMTPTYTLNF